MTLYLAALALALGVTLGWNAAKVAAARWSRSRPGGGRRARPAGIVTTPDPGPGPAPYDWRHEPTVATCHLCRGLGRVVTINGRAGRCPCGATTTHGTEAAAT